MKAPTDAPKHHLLRVLGITFGLAIGIGTTIGGGILRTPGDIAALLPTPLLFMAVWVFGAINALLGATVFSELGAMLPRAGGPYVFARRALGDYAGFFVGYTYWIQICAVQAALSLLIGEYMPVLIPALSGHALGVAFTVLLVLVILQWQGVRWGGYVQTIVTLIKVLAFTALIIAAFVMPHAAASGAPALAVPHGLALMAALILAMQGIIFTYNGFFYVCFFGEELRDPGRDVPRAVFQSVLTIIAVYVLLNLAFLWVLPISRMAHAPFVGGLMARALFGERGDRIITAIVMISLLGTINAQILISARVLLAMGRNGLFLRRATTVNRGGTPTVGLALGTLMAGAFMLSGTFNAVLGVIAVFMVVNYLLMYVSLMMLRRREPETPRPYHAWGYPWTTLLATGIGLVFLIGVIASDTRHTLIALACLLASYPVYLGIRKLRCRM
ncbi:MAG TPA: APC family permease [Gammaproteobacteria bacterium]|nr:APC family permease [Gammaproteobacteria bacterium]